MSSRLAVTLSELTLSWKRVCLDRDTERSFVHHRDLRLWVEHDPEAWLKTVRDALANGTYEPAPCRTCYAPKSGWTVRPGAVLEPEDEVVYNTLLWRLYPSIWNAISASQGKTDIAYQLVLPRAAKPKWIDGGFRVWDEWRVKSLQQLKARTRYVLFADISAFYENIDFGVLHSELRAMGGSTEVVVLLMECLRMWAQPRMKGIPQGLSASDLLAKVYMNAVDQHLTNEKVKFIRYVDDVRVFCRTQLDAKRAILILNDVLRRRGLNLQTAKTEIKTADEAKFKIEGAVPLVKEIENELPQLLQTAPYRATGNIVRRVARRVVRRIASTRDELSAQALITAFTERFSSGSEFEFNGTLFHFLLTRLGAVQSDVAVEYCTNVLHHRPEETSHVLRYLGRLTLPTNIYIRVIQYIESEEAIYDYQKYEILSWFLESQRKMPSLLSLCREWAFDANRDPWVRTVARAYVGRYGNHADLERIQGAFATASTPIERAEFLSALARMEKGRRNEFYGRVKHDSPLIEAAIFLAKAWKERTTVS